MCFIMLSLYYYYINIISLCSLFQCIISIIIIISFHFYRLKPNINGKTPSDMPSEPGANRSSAGLSPPPSSLFRISRARGSSAENVNGGATPVSSSMSNRCIRVFLLDKKEFIVPLEVSMGICCWSFTTRFVILRNLP